FGGINFIEFLPQDQVIVNPLRVPPAVLNELQSSIVLCFTGQSRVSDEIIRQQIKVAEFGDDSALEGFHQLKRDALEMKRALLAGDIDQLARTMDRSWISKKRTAQFISTPKIDALEAVARANGAKSAKVSGAGGGGYMIFVVDPKDKP